MFTRPCPIRVTGWLRVVTWTALSAAISTPTLLELSRYVRAQSWRPTDAVVLRVLARTDEAQLDYLYRFEHRLKHGNSWSAFARAAKDDRRRILTHFDPGDSLTVFVNPANPDESVVRRGPFRPAYIWKSMLLSSVFTYLATHEIRQMYAAVRQREFEEDLHQARMDWLRRRHAAGWPGASVLPASRKAATITSQTTPSACQNQAEKVTPHEYSWS